MKRIRVLQVLDQISYNSGACAVVMNYYEHMNTQKIIFDFMVHEQVDDELKNIIESKGSRIYIMPSLSVRNMFLYGKTLRTFFQKHTEYKIVHGNIPNASAFYLAAAKRKGVPVRILHAHSSRGSACFWKRIRNFLLSRIGVCCANTYFACSRSAAKYMYGAQTRRALILKNAIEIGRYQFDEGKRAEYRKKLEVENYVVLGHVGRFSEEKNHMFLLDILNILWTRGTQCKLLLIGDGHERERVENKANELGMQEHVIYTGVVNNVECYLNAMDVFLLPSFFEGMPVVGVEAQSNGLPCIFSNAVTDEAKILDTTEYLALGMPELWADKIVNMKKERVADAWKQVEKHGYSIEKEAEKLESYYIKRSIQV